MSKTDKRKLLRLFIFILNVTLFCTACDKVKKLEEQELLLLGSWKMKIRNTNKILIFKTNNVFVYEERVEGKFSKIIEKKGSVIGKWTQENNLLHISLTAKDPDIDIPWDQDGTVTFNIVELTKKKLIFLEQNGREYKWERVRSRKTVMEDQNQFVVKLAPIVVNLKRTSAKKRWYLCLEIEFVFEHSDHNASTVHPRVREVVIFFLSSLEHRDVSNLKKAVAISKTLKKKLYPYYKDKLSDVLISNIIVTTKTDEVDKFIEKTKGKNTAGPKEQ